VNNKSIGIEAIEYYLPSKMTSSEDLATQYGFDKDFIEDKVGVTNLYTVQNNETVLDMSVKALEKILLRKPKLRECIDLLVVCTQTPDYQLPQMSSQVQSKCNLPISLASFDISLGCSGFVYGLSIVESMMKTHGFSNSILITVDAYSKIINKNDRNTKCLFSDAAAAILVSNNGSVLSGEYNFGTDGDYFDRLIVPNFSSLKVDKKPYLYMDGRAIFNFTVSTIPSEINKICIKNGIKKNNINYFVLHQASRFVIQSIAKKTGEDPDKFVDYLHKFGNTVSSSIPIALKELLLNDNEVGTNILIAGFGVGLSWASTILIIKGKNNV
jgi:3-oxoacyl-[acyl-carrier-protein] synthase III